MVPSRAATNNLGRARSIDASDPSWAPCNNEYTSDNGGSFLQRRYRPGARSAIGPYYARAPTAKGEAELVMDPAPPRCRC